MGPALRVLPGGPQPHPALTHDPSAAGPGASLGPPAEAKNEENDPRL
jgi:hypothetical protein